MATAGNPTFRFRMVEPKTGGRGTKGVTCRFDRFRAICLSQISGVR